MIYKKTLRNRDGQISGVMDACSTCEPPEVAPRPFDDEDPERAIDHLYGVLRQNHPPEARWLIWAVPEGLSPRERAVAIGMLRRRARADGVGVEILG